MRPRRLVVEKRSRACWSKAGELWVRAEATRSIGFWGGGLGGGGGGVEGDGGDGEGFMGFFGGGGFFYLILFVFLGGGDIDDE